ncbi:MAG: hypothetical protein WC111_10855, partial [Candidatus Cloacimonadaceae bacterium]
PSGTQFQIAPTTPLTPSESQRDAISDSTHYPTHTRQSPIGTAISDSTHHPTHTRQSPTGTPFQIASVNPLTPARVPSGRHFR